MKTFSIHSVRNVLAVVVALGLGYAAYLVNPGSFVVSKVEAGSAQNVSGWGWSDTIGWISFNDVDTKGICDANANGFTDASCGGSDTSATPMRVYGVNVDVTNKGNTSAPYTGDFSGTAWSDNVGWISFDRSVTGKPPSAPFNIATGPIAQVDWSTGKVTGWARALSGCEVTPGVPVTSCAGSGAGAAAGGWDGWIKLSKDTGDTGATYGVTISGNKFSGYAWGGSDSTTGLPGVVGWVDFTPTISSIPVGVQVSAPPCDASSVTTWGTCQPISQCPATSTSGIRIGICSGGGTVAQGCTLATASCTGSGSGGGTGGGTGGTATSTNWWQF